MTIAINGLRNPSWITTPQTSSIRIETRNSVDGSYGTTAVISSNVRFTPELTPGTITFNAGVKNDVSPANLVGELTAYTLTFTIETELPQGSMIDLSFPVNAFDITTGQTVCTNGATTLSCPDADMTLWTVGNLNTNNLQKLRLKDPCSAAVCVAGTQFVIKLDKVSNGGTDKAIPNTFSFLSMTGDRFEVDVGQS
jgi:hypothetical protein